MPNRPTVLKYCRRLQSTQRQYFGVLRVVEDVLQQLDRVLDMSGLSNDDNINGCEKPLTSQFETQFTIVVHLSFEEDSEDKTLREKSRCYPKYNDRLSANIWLLF